MERFEELGESYQENSEKNKIVQVLCERCDWSTRHMIMQSYAYNYRHMMNGTDIGYGSSYQIIQCQGCMELSFRALDWFCADPAGPRETLYPKRSPKRSNDTNTIPIKNFSPYVPTNLRKIYSESITCFNGDSFILTTAGLRALVEGLCANLGITDGPKEITKKDEQKKIIRISNLEGKIAGLYENGFLTEKNANVLHALRYLGNDAVHELVQPSRDELVLAIEIIEHIFESVFKLPRQAEELRSKRDERVMKTQQTDSSDEQSAEPF